MSSIHFVEFGKKVLYQTCFGKANQGLMEGGAFLIASDVTVTVLYLERNLKYQSSSNIKQLNNKEI